MTVGSDAVEAAAHWQGTVKFLIMHRENAVFEMGGPFGRAALRLHRPGYQTAQTIRSELWWCTQLADAGVPVPAPLMARDGSVMVRLASGVLASAVTWADGKPLGETGKPISAPLPVLLDQHQALGRLLARMHGATDGLTLPADFSRPRWDAEGLTGEAPLWGRFWDHPAANADQRMQLLRARDALREWLAGYGGETGLIHADVLRENIFVSDKGVTQIDFDDSGFGYRLYDLGTAMLANFAEPAWAQLQDALVSGYGETRLVDRHAVEMFTLARACASVGWTMPRLPPESAVNQSHLARCTTLIARIIQ